MITPSILRSFCSNSQICTLDFCALVLSDAAWGVQGVALRAVKTGKTSGMQSWEVAGGRWGAGPTHVLKEPKNEVLQYIHRRLGQFLLMRGTVWDTLPRALAWAGGTDNGLGHDLLKLRHGCCFCTGLGRRLI